MAVADGRGIPLDEFTTVTPPGWKPHMSDYAFRLYREKVRLWLRITEIQDNTNIGPTVVGRLRGAACRLVVKMRLASQNGQVLIDDEAVAALSGNEILEDIQAGHPYVAGLLQAWT